MSVPTHNLYDFVHLVTKRKFFLMYFYPWGSRDLNDVCHYIQNEQFLNSPKGISCKDQLGQKLLGKCDMKHITVLQPVLFCYDQEPLNFDFYSDQNPNMLQHKIKRESYSLSFGRTLNELNLKWQNADNFQITWTLLHSELNSPQLARYESTGLFKGAYWWSHAALARDWYRYAEHDTSLEPEQQWKKLFLVYCRENTGSREYRKDFLKLINNISCQTSSFDNSPVDSNASAIYNVEDHNLTAISVVLETVFDQRIHLTEKTLRPIACGHPFMLAAGPGSLALLGHYGFKTFSPYINEEYDLEQDHARRLHLISEEMHRINSMSLEQQHTLVAQCRQIAKYNKKHFFSKDFFEQITCELRDNVSTAFQKHQGQLDLTAWWREHQWRKRNCPETCRDPIYKNHSEYLIPLYRRQRTKNDLLYHSNPDPDLLS
jgi:hypothetical protein